MFSKHGAEIDDMSLVRDDDVLFISAGEDYVADPGKFVCLFVHSTSSVKGGPGAVMIYERTILPIRASAKLTYFRGCAAVFCHNALLYI